MISKYSWYKVTSVVMSFLPCIWSSEKRQEISTYFNFFLFEYTFSASFLFKNLTIVLSVFSSLWQAIIRDLSRLIPISCKRCSMKFSRSFGATELGMPEKSKHPSILFQFVMLSFKLYEFATRSLESLLQNFWGVLCHWNITC